MARVQCEESMILGRLQSKTLISKMDMIHRRTDEWRNDRKSDDGLMYSGTGRDRRFEMRSLWNGIVQYALAVGMQQ